MIAEVVSVGTELLLGQIVNTDASYLARRLSEAGVTLHHMTTVGDNEGRLLEAIQTALSRADIVITTGGVGPTADDITKELSAKALGLPMVRNEEAEKTLRAWFQKSAFPMTDNNLRQADFPEGALLLCNSFGTAPGCIAQKDNKVIVNLPGPPRELIPMFDTGVMPYLVERSGALIVSRYLRIFGKGESMVESLLSDLVQSTTNPTLATYCTLGEVQIRMTVRVAQTKDADALFDPIETEIRRRIGDCIYKVTDDPSYTMEQAVFEALRENNRTVAVAESCTGGMIATRLTSVPGISSCFMEGYVTYANAAKVRMIGVPEDMLAVHGAVSEEVARAMAEGLRERSGADICLSVTGIAGPDGGTEEKPVGLVYIGLATEEGTQVRKLNLTGDRDRIRTLSTLHGLNWIMEAARR